MLIVIGLLLVFFPASIALVMHDLFVRRLDTAGRKWIWYGAYCGVISWVLLAAKYMQHWGEYTVLAAFSSIKNLTLYGLLAIAAAIIVPLLLSLLYILFGSKAKKENDHER